MNGINALIAQGGGRLPQAPDLLGMQRNALINQRLKMENAMLPEQQDWARQEQQLKVRGAELDMKLKEYQVEEQPLKKEAKGLILLQSLAGSGLINSQNFAQYRDFLVKKGMNPLIFRGVQPGDEQALQNWLSQVSTSTAQRIELLKSQQAASFKERELGLKEREVKVKERPKEPAPTELEKLIEKYNSLPPGDEKQFYLARINKLTQATGMRLTMDKDGNVTLTQGPLGGGKEGFAGLSPKVKGQIEEKLLGGKEQLARLQAIAGEFKPEYLETGTRLKSSWTGLKAKLGYGIPAQDKEQLIGFKKFQRKAIENINLYIKELTGAQMSEKEANRLRLAQPDPGEKWYQGDDPITFKAKTDDILKTVRASVARYEYYKAKGLSDPEIKGLINSDKALSLDTLANRIK